MSDVKQIALEALAYGSCKSLESARRIADEARKTGVLGMYPAACVVLDMQLSRLMYASAINAELLEALQPSEQFSVVVFEDKNGTRYLYSDSALGAISGPGKEDKTIAEFSSADCEVKAWGVIYNTGSGTYQVRIDEPRDGHPNVAFKEPLYARAAIAALEADIAAPQAAAINAELLEALQALVGHTDDMMPTRLWDAARAAIAKATGEAA